MVIDNFDIINSCRICRSINQDEEYENLFANIMDKDEFGGDGLQLSETGRLYEELIEVTIDNEDVDLYPQYLCHSCDLQIRLFKKLKVRANKTLMELHEFYDNIQKSADFNLNDGHLPTIQSQIDEETVLEDQLAEQQQQFNNNFETNSYIDEYNCPDGISEEEFSNNAIDSSSLSPLSPECNVNYLNDCNDGNQTQPKIAYQIQICQMNNSNSLQLQDYEAFSRDDDDDGDEMVMQLSENDSTTDNSEKLNDHKVKRKTEEYFNADIESELLIDETSCLVCNVQFECLQTAKLHRKKYHDEKYACDKCNKLFNSLKSLKIHMNLHFGNLEYQCELCQRSFNQKVHYQNHMNRHNNVRNFQCNMCDKAFFTKSDMKIHQRTHTGHRPYACSTCGKYYMILEHLKMHSYTHSQQKFECDTCQQKFVSPSTLRQHKQTIHAAEPRFKCEQCCKSFRRKHHLMNHMKVHEKHSLNNEILDTKQFFEILSDDSTTGLETATINDNAIDDIDDADADASSIKLFDPDIIVGQDEDEEDDCNNNNNIDDDDVETIEYL